MAAQSPPIELLPTLPECYSCSKEPAWLVLTRQAALVVNPA